MTAPRVHRVPSRILGATRRVRVLVPPDARALLVMNDGANVFASPRTRGSREKWRAERAARAVPGLAIAAVDADRRRVRDYLPYADPAVPRRLRRYEADRYAAFIADELVPYLEARYPALARVAARGIGGSSYGAVAALWTALRAPLFTRLLVESVPPWIGDGRLFEDVRASDVAPRRAWVGTGTSESRRDATSARMVGGARELGRILRERGCRVRVTIDDGAGHDERAWARRLPDALRFLFG